MIFGELLCYGMIEKRNYCENSIEIIPVIIDNNEAWARL